MREPTISSHQDRSLLSRAYSKSTYANQHLKLATEALYYQENVPDATGFV